MQSFPPSFTVLKLSQVENRRAVAMVTNEKILSFESIFFLSLYLQSKVARPLLGSCAGAGPPRAELPTNWTPRERDIQRLKHREEKKTSKEILSRWEIETSSDWKIGKVETMREWDIEILSQRENKWLRESVSDRTGNLENNVGAYSFSRTAKKINICELVFTCHFRAGNITLNSVVVDLYDSVADTFSQ